MSEKVPRRCIHFTGVQNQRCRAGIEYQAFRHGLMEKGFPGWLPCLSDETDCRARTRKTAEDLAEEERQFEEIFELVRKARSGILANADTSGRAIIKCPKCANGLVWIVASNGHVHGKCTTPDCIRWME